MSKQLDNLISKLNNQTYFTESPVNCSGHEDFKYFLCFSNTHKIIREWRTQAEAIENLREIIQEGIIRDGSLEIIVVDESPIRSARKKAGLTQKEAWTLLEVPSRTWESWEMGTRNPAPWAEKLIVEKLNSIKNKGRN